MSLDGVTGSGSAAAIRGADAAARAGGVLASLATRPRQAPLDAFQIAGRPASQRSRSSQAESPPGDAAAARTARDQSDGQASAQAVSAFIAQSLAQEQDQDQDQASLLPTSQISVGLRAYARATGAGAVPVDAGVEVIPPRLSSGHALDLAV